ncbi:hypothetical protein FB451DRAFT_1403224 [Mycena latifolia]|nr:hypothetical protein FB451DRAFT_1403224 [Mycena latifolia]
MPSMFLQRLALSSLRHKVFPPTRRHTIIMGRPVDDIRMGIVALAAVDSHEYKNPFIDAWGRWYGVIPKSEFPRFIRPYEYMDFVSAADLYLIQRFNLAVDDDSKRPSNVTLHDLENALSTIVAGMFWILGHILPIHGLAIEGAEQQILLKAPPEPPILLKGNATVNEIIARTRLDLNIIAVLVGLAASIAIARISLQYSRFHKIPKEDEDIATDGTGILHTIWLYRNHPELQRLLEQVEHPTDENLRKAGMVRTRFAGRPQTSLVSI